MPGLTTTSFDLAWSCVDNSGATLALTDSSVTTTGANQPNLAVRSNVLQAGVEYTFKLTATYPGQNPGESTVKVAISTPPRGGKIAVPPEPGYELETEFTLTAPNWNGDGNLYYTYVAEDADGNGIPDYIELAATVLDSTWVLEVDGLGYDPPPSANGLDGDEYDVYFSDLGRGAAYGYTYPEQGGNTTYSKT